jgi:hypothetical protein
MRALLAQAESSRPSKQSVERDLLDQNIAGLRANITVSDQELQALVAQGD